MAAIFIPPNDCSGDCSSSFGNLQGLVQLICLRVTFAIMLRKMDPMTPV
jgi:hypothetical protein